MVSQATRPLSELIADHELVTAAVTRGVRDALLTHARMGNSVCGMMDGKIVTLSPEEIFARFGNIDAPATNNSK